MPQLYVIVLASCCCSAAIALYRTRIEDQVLRMPAHETQETFDFSERFTKFAPGLSALSGCQHQRAVRAAVLLCGVCLAASLFA